MSVSIILGDALSQLSLMPTESAHCCVTSPPYYGLRDYGVAGQIGLEASPDEYVAALVAVFREVRRVLRKDGTLWLNLGDSYAGSGKGGNPDAGKQATNQGSQSVGVLYGKTGETARQAAVTNVTRGPVGGCKAKDLIGIPWLVAFALRADGWWLRQEIIWHKPAPMPESVLDRCTRAHESIFLLAKSERYYFDGAAIAEKAKDGAKLFNGGHNVGADRQDNGRQDRSDIDNRNKRSVWTVVSEPFPKAHFATYPPALIEPCILAGCPQGGTVLDPFGGAGTTGLVADRLGRSAVLVEINPEYAQMARRRLHNDAPLFADIALHSSAKECAA